MDEATFAQTLFTLLMLAIFLGLFTWGIRSGQFRNVEAAKYLVVEPDEDERGRQV
jgi:cbb3-type cytochrome oxidase maturation protein